MQEEQHRSEDEDEEEDEDKDKDEAHEEVVAKTLRGPLVIFSGSGSSGAPWRLRYCGELWRMDLLATPFTFVQHQSTSHCHHEQRYHTCA
jgi:hypothetical protein